jgi:Asp/Glu/hydantoin racemase
MSQKTVGIIHTSFVSVNDLKQLFAQIVPEVRLLNIVDDSLLSEVMAHGSVTPGVLRRMCSYAATLQDLGVDLILNQCSSVGEAAEHAAALLSVPVLRIDQPMAQKAAEIGSRIALVATVASTVEVSVRLLEREAARAGRQATVVPHLVDGALDMLLNRGDRETHNRLVLGEIRRAEKDSDVIVLAQGSMVVLLPLLSHTAVPVLTSPRLAVERVRQMLFPA